MFQHRAIMFAAGGAVVLYGLSQILARSAGGVRRRLKYVPWRLVDLASDAKADSGILVVDCTHPHLPCLTHHKVKDEKMPPQSLRGDTSSDIVLNAIKRRSPIMATASAVTCNHFDVDAFVSVWSAMNPDLALQYEAALRRCAHVGDFRELDFSLPGAELGLKAACWLNTMERRHFSRPFEDGDEDKWPWFLAEGRFAALLSDPETRRDEWEEEYGKVLDGLATIRKSGRVQRFPEAGLVTVELPHPVHYYALFSQTVGADVVLAHYGSGRVEVEQKYTQFVDLASRNAGPRIDMLRLAAFLNEQERRCREGEANGTGQGAVRSGPREEWCAASLREDESAAVMVGNEEAMGEEALGPGGAAVLVSEERWKVDRFVDSGPLLRLERRQTLTRAERYGHPTERAIHLSLIPLTALTNYVRSYLAHGLSSAPSKARWSWEELHALNAGIDWLPWEREARAMPLVS